MATNDAELRIGGDSSQLIDACNKAEQSVKQTFERMQASVSSLDKVFQRLQSSFLAVTAVMAGGKAFKEVISATTNEAAEVSKLEKVFGMTAESASSLNVALKLTGQSAEDFSAMAFKLLRNINSNEQGINDLGVATRDTATGGMRPMMDIMESAAKVLLQYKEGADRDAAAMYLFGRGAQEAMAILKLNADVMARANTLADAYGLKMGDEAVAASKKFKMEQAALGIMFDSINVKIGESVMPALTQLAGWFNDIGPALVNAFAWSLKHLIQFFEETGFAIRMLWDACQDFYERITLLFGGIAQAWDRLINGQYRAAKDVMSNTLDLIESNVKAHAERRLKIEMDTVDRVRKLWSGETGDSAETSKEPSGKGSKAWHEPGSDGKKDKASDTRFQEWKSSLESMKEVEGDFFKSSLAMEESYWQQKLASLDKNSKKDAQTYREVQHELYAIHKQQAQQERDLAEEGNAQRVRLGKEEVDARRETLRLKREVGEISEAQELQASIDLANDEYDIELQALRDKMALYEMDKVQRQKILNEIELLEKQHAKTIQKINDDIRVEEKKSFEQMLSPIASAIDKSVTGMIMGTTTLKKALSNLFTSILGEFTNLVSKIVVKWAAGELAKTQAFKEGSMIRSALEKLGILESTSEEAAATASKIAAAKAAAAGTIPAEAAMAAGGAASAVAPIPIVGPAMATAAYAQTMSMVMAGLSVASASGGFDIPAGVNPMTQLHQEEMVLPADIAKPLRQNLGGGGLGGDTHLHVHAVDAASVERLFRDNGHILAREMRRQVRNFTPKNV